MIVDRATEDQTKAAMVLNRRLSRRRVGIGRQECELWYLAGPDGALGGQALRVKGIELAGPSWNNGARWPAPFEWKN
jgi:hypothetical protein